MPALTLQLLDQPYAICRLPAGAAAPSPPPGSFSLLIQAVEETTVVCPIDQAPGLAEIDPGWRCLRLLHFQHRLRAGESG
jgi:hypothetical protein